MTEVSETVWADPDRIFAVLADGWLYPLWVVGASHMRQVDDSWPAVGTRIHHSVGPWPMQIRHTTSITAVEPGRRLELDAGLWPIGSARVWLILTPIGDNQTRVTMGELFDRGPARLMPMALQSALLRARNTEALRRLADIAEHRETACERVRPSRTT